MAEIKKFDPSRLYAALLNTGLQTRDNPTYQVIYQLIAQLAKLTKDLAVFFGGGGSGGGTTTINQTIQFLDLTGNDSGGSDDGSIMMIGSGVVSTSSTHYDAPLTDGSLDETDLIFASGECVIVQVPV